MYDIELTFHLIILFSMILFDPEKKVICIIIKSIKYVVLITDELTFMSPKITLLEISELLAPPLIVSN